MKAIEKTSSEVVPVSAANLLTNAMAVLCGLAVLVAICLAKPGLDMSAGLF